MKSQQKISKNSNERAGMTKIPNEVGFFEKN